MYFQTIAFLADMLVHFTRHENKHTGRSKFYLTSVEKQLRRLNARQLLLLLTLLPKQAVVLKTLKTWIQRTFGLLDRVIRHLDRSSFL